jgi:hypothetical protein
MPKITFIKGERPVRIVFTNAPPILAPQSCKICGKPSDSQVCPNGPCQIEFYSAEYQEWPEDDSEEQAEWPEEEY